MVVLLTHSVYKMEEIVCCRLINIGFRLREGYYVNCSYESKYFE